MRKVSRIGIDIIKQFEGFSAKPYPDPGTGAKPYTIGYGTIQYENDVKVTMQDPAISEERATELLEFEVNKKAEAVEKMTKVSLNDNEFAALSSFSYNVGSSALEKSTLMKLLNAGTDRAAVADQFLRWDKAGGKVLPGLTRRRQAERSLFLQPIQDDNQLPNGPTEEDINKKLDNIEKDILK